MPFAIITKVKTPHSYMPDKTPSSFVIIAMTTLFTTATPIMQRLSLLSHFRPTDNEDSYGHSWDTYEKSIDEQCLLSLFRVENAE